MSLAAAQEISFDAAVEGVLLDLDGIFWTLNGERNEKTPVIFCFFLFLSPKDKLNFSLVSGSVKATNITQ